MRLRPLLLPALLALAGCPRAPSAPGTSSAPPSGPPAEVREACARCHVFPPADALPRERWARILPDMRGMPPPPGVAPLTVPELEAAQAYYAASAPAALAQSPPGPPVDAEALARFQVETFTPPGLDARRMPASADVVFWRLFHRAQRDLVVAEMRARSLFLLAPWAPADRRELRLLQRDLDYPCRLTPADVDGDGREDLLVSSLGGMNPGNHTQGAVWLLRQVDGKQLEPRALARGLGRVADVEAADLDGDGDLDLVAAVFGWRGPGQLLLLEAKGELRFEPRVLDERDGCTELALADVDGDGRTDVVALVAQEHEQVVAWLNHPGEGGAPSFSPRVLYQAPHPAWGSSGMQRVDLDGDGDQDLLLANGDALDDDLLKPYHGVGWLENLGGMDFAYRRIADLYGCEQARAGDLDGDGDLDVVVVSFLPQLPPAVWRERGIPSIVWLERDGATWRPRVLERGDCVHPTLTLDDWNGDGKLDIAVGSYVWVDPDGAPRSQADYVTLLTAR